MIIATQHVTALIVTGALIALQPEGAWPGNGREHSHDPPSGAQADRRPTSEWCDRKEFVSRMAQITEGMSARDVLRIMGKPDDILTRLDPGWYWIGRSKEGWCYGTQGHLMFPTLGCICLDKDGKVTKIFGNEGKPPGASLITGGQLRELLNRLNGPEGGDYPPLSVIQAVNMLQPLGKEKALAVIEEYLRLGIPWGTSSDLVYVIRVLFEDRERRSQMPSIMAGRTIPAEPRDQSRLPQFPIWLEDDIPFDLIVGIEPTTQPESVEDHLAFFRRAGRLRAKPLHPTDTPWKIYDRFASSLKWLYLPTDSFGRGKRKIANQLLNLVHTVYLTQGDQKDAPVDSPEEWERRWSKQYSEISNLQIRWDEKKMIYTFLDGSSLPGGRPKGYRPQIWELEDGPRETVLVIERQGPTHVQVAIRQTAPDGLGQIPLTFKVFEVKGARKLLASLGSRPGASVEDAIRRFKGGGGVVQLHGFWESTRQEDLELYEGQKIYVELIKDKGPKESREFAP